FVMSDLEDSTVTYTEAPPSPDYVLGPEEPEQAPPPPDFVPEPIYPKLMPLEDDVILLSPIPEEDLKEDDEDPEKDLTDYPTDRDDDDDDKEESSRDDANDEDEDEDEDEEEEEHLAPAVFEPPPACRTTARMSIQDQTPIPFPSAAEVGKFLTISTPSSSPLTSYSSPLPQIPSPPLPVSSPLLMSPPPLPASPTHPLGYKAAMIRLRSKSPSTSHPLPLPSPIVLPHTRASVAMMRVVAPSTYILAPRSEILPSKTPPSGTPPLLHIPLPTPLPPLLLISTDCRAGVSEVMLPPQKRLCIALGPRFEVGKSSSAPTARPTRGFRAGYGFVGTLDDEIRRDPERERMTAFVTTVRQDTNEIYRRLDDVQDDRLLMSGQLNMLRRDRRAYARTTRLMKIEARLSHEA
ncbi:hypothetical protein Tco_1234045, partial [Tanacetum coccineum]